MACTLSHFNYNNIIMHTMTVVMFQEIKGVIVKINHTQGASSVITLLRHYCNLTLYSVHSPLK